MQVLFSSALIALHVLIHSSHAKDKLHHNLHEFLDIQPHYNLHRYPKPLDGGPLHVNFSINVRSIFSLNEMEEILSLEASLRMYWKETRVRVKLPEDYPKRYITLNPAMAEHFWIPDLFIDRTKSIRIPSYYTKPASLRIYNDSTMRYSSRINFDVACDLDLQFFPVDKQVCEVNFESFGHGHDEIAVRWRTDLSNINPNITLNQFNYTIELENTYVTDYNDHGKYPGLFMRICLSRYISYHLVQTYLPSVLLVILSWLSTYISPEVVPGRVTMGMTTLLTTTAMFASVRQSVPRHSYITLLDIWMVSVMFFIFCIMLEFIIANVLCQRGNKTLAVKLDASMRIAYPVTFLFFNVLYWPQILDSYHSDPCHVQNPHS